jgi:allantoicase
MNPDLDFRTLPDLALRTLGGSVVWANDEFFAQRENLLLPSPAVFDQEGFGHKGKVYDGWETRRRREPGHDEVIVRLGAAGIVHGVVIDTAWFKGNYPPEASVEATCVNGYPSAAELNRDATWQTIVPRTVIKGDQENNFPVESRQRWTHIRLSIYPDGGVARLRVHGEVVPDPRLLDGGGIDLAALDNGGLVVGCSNMFYSSPSNLISPGLVRTMGEGWETARRRDDRNDWVTVQLAAAGSVRLAELDTSYFIGNAPGWASLSGRDAVSTDPQGNAEWFELLPRTRLQPDTRHRVVLSDAPRATQVRLDIYPDGGMARLRLFGELDPVGRQHAGLRWFNALPPAAAIEVLTTELGTGPDEAAALVAARPITETGSLTDGVRLLLAGDAGRALEESTKPTR